ncbi:MAG: LTA synthase family protein [Deltaproteobacteria bacterium]|nr:LTA synthase family protein [Deltaproteobacteria bacterium]
MSLFRHVLVRYLTALGLVWLAAFFLTRCALLVGHFGQIDPGLLDVLRIFGVGLIFDLGFLTYAVAFLAALLMLAPRRLWAGRKVALRVLTTAVLFVMFFTATAEWLFWDEFSSRFNFIAVDYLVYSHEVVNNILESYPVYPLLALFVLLAMAGAVLLHRTLDRVPDAGPVRRPWPFLAGLAALALLVTAGIDQDFPRGLGGDVPQRELAGNGPFRFFAAFRNNELDYGQFYATMPERELGELLRREVGEPNARFLNVDPLDIRRSIDNPGQFSPLNVVLVTVESLSAKYLGSFGDTCGLTPNLDRLRAESLFFTNVYATGTRTDRALEAITLSLPPTPGRSIVKRLGRESGYASLGRQLGAKGYDCAFLYGGRGYFDNMNAFFSGNGYRIVDQSSVPEEEISFKNAWGMCDEDLYSQTLRQADVDTAVGKPFFFHLMTTSNHRPFTYPEGRIDVPSGYGRDGAVKYTDFALGRFLDQARTKPWFDRTIFIIVADHDANSAGKDDLPVAKYHIPLLVYAPRLIPARDVDILASQIDLAPTLLGLLNMDYESTFFGRNVLREDAAPGRALIGNYQHLGLFDGQSLAILSPRRGLRRHDDALGLSDESAASVSDPLVRRDIAYYQGASHGFRHGLLRWPSGRAR